MLTSSLAIDAVLPQIIKELHETSPLILSAPPGAGKTTRVPLAILESGLLRDMKLVMLEPRRLAARRSAEYMASLLGEEVGARVGYRIRGESRAGVAIEVVTEGVLTRMLQRSPDLDGVGMVVFDEFHERSIHADLGLALVLDVRRHLREDLRVLVMSATLDGVALSRVMPEAKVIRSEGRNYPVETRYAAFPPDGPIERAVAVTVRNALVRDHGDILVFLPGQREIRRVESLLAEKPLPENVRVLSLYSDAPRDQQLRALAPPDSSVRKVILSTNVAETSITIEGVCVVIDSGLVRVSRFDPRRGMSGLVTVPVSRSSADQRRGRAGRTQPGICYRLWTRDQENDLPSHATPEILATDLAPLALEIAAWGGMGSLQFIDPPPEAHFAQALTLLHRLGAVDDAGRLTAHGRDMSELPVHPRLAHMILTATLRGYGALACDLAAILEESDPLPGRQDVDVRSRWEVLNEGEGGGRGVRILREARRLRGIVGIGDDRPGDQNFGLLLSLAYPDRIGRQREPGGGRYVLTGGTGAVLPRGSLLAREKFIVVADLDAAGTEALVRLSAPVTLADLEAVHRVEEREEIVWDEKREAVISRRARILGQIALEDHHIPAEGEKILPVFLDGVRKMGLSVLPWDRDSRALRDRSEWYRLTGLAPDGWPDLSESGLSQALPDWLGPFIGGMSRREHLSRLDLAGILRGYLGPSNLKELERNAPVTITVPSGSRIRLDYEGGATPVLAVKLQELFGLTQTPAIAGGRVSLLIHLLSPAGRPLAVTGDLASFWKNSYPEVRKEMRGRYPKHPWPENPLSAHPTARAKRRVS